MNTDWAAGAAAVAQPLGVQVMLAAVAPLVTALVGGVVVGFLLRFADRRARDREHTRDVAEQQAIRDRDEIQRVNALRRDFISRFSALTYSVHYRLEHLARSVRHGSGTEDSQLDLARDIERYFIDARSKLGALQYEVDSFYDGHDAGDGLHRVIDLLMVKYMRTMPVSPEQRKELVESVIPNDRHAHSGLSLSQLADVGEVDTAFSWAVQTTLGALMTEQVEPSAFSSSKLLTGPDGDPRPINETEGSPAG